ncbi:MAG: transcriptional regulator, LuxR family [Frankiales bacterium]|nr:transcriptional regulator, LuxR family [Frankiales bacterium]
MRGAVRALEAAAVAAPDADALHETLLAQLPRLLGGGPLFLAAVDPVTLHFTRTSRRDIPDEAAKEFLAHEIGVDDVVKFRGLAAAPDPVGTLFQATGETPARSARWRDVIEPLGWGDELRVALQDGGHTWAFLCLHRDIGDVPFGRQDVAVARSVAPVLAGALRRAAVGGAASDDAPTPGILVLDEDYVVTSMTGAVAQWLELMGGAEPGIPFAVMSLAALAMRTGDAQVVHTVTRDGRWMGVHASPLYGTGPDRVAIVLESAHPTAALPAFAAAARLTKRETEVLEAALGGLADRAIARSLLLSEHTVQDHLKAIYRKAGVRSRGELVARLLSR